MKRYSEKIMNALQEMLQIDKEDSVDEIRKFYTQDEIFDAVLNYEGIIGYGETIIKLIEEIYNVDLELCTD